MHSFHGAEKSSLGRDHHGQSVRGTDWLEMQRLGVDDGDNLSPDDVMCKLDAYISDYTNISIRLLIILQSRLLLGLSPQLVPSTSLDLSLNLPLS